MKTKQTDIVKSSLIIKDALKKRFKELNLKYNDIVKEAKKYNIYFSKQQLSIYFNYPSSKHGYPSQKQIIWMCFRYSINIILKIKVDEYDEKKAVEFTNKFFK